MKKLHLNSMHRKALKILNAVRTRKSSNFEQVASVMSIHTGIKMDAEICYQDDGLSRDMMKP